MRGLSIDTATDADREVVERLRHEVYAVELGHYPVQPDGVLREQSWADTVYLAVRDGGGVAGFVAITPPWAPRFGIERYVDGPGRGPDVFEVRALTVDRRARTGLAAAALMVGALRWIAGHGGRSIVAMGRDDLIDTYVRLGLAGRGAAFAAGAQRYRVLTAAVAELERHAERRHRRLVRAVAEGIDWRLDVPRGLGEGSEHGGRSITVVGPRFELMAERESIVPADVLDAWFPPAPGALAALAEDPAWLSHTSPPADATGLRDAIAATRSIPRESVVVGAGSSDLIYRALPQIVHSGSRVLLVRPTYGEYPHLLERVLGARVDYLRLREADDWALDLAELRETLRREYDLVVLVNPANPVGGHVPRDDLAPVLAGAPPSTWIWVDEAYVDYTGPDQSLECLAVTVDRLIVGKSLSKVYGLSGHRAAYLATSPDNAARLRRLCPPWPVSLPGQLAAVRALADPAHYRRAWAATARLRGNLATRLSALPEVRVLESAANFVLLRLPQPCSAARVVQACRDAGVYLRDLSPLSADLCGRWVRVAVRTPDENERVAQALGRALP